MATSPATPAISVQIQSPAVRPAESRPNREAANKGSDFGSELKRELNRDRSDAPAVATPTTQEKTASQNACTEEPAAPTEQAQTQAATLDPWLAMLQGAATAAPTVAGRTELEKAPLLETKGQDQADANGLATESAQLLALQGALKSAAGAQDQAADTQQATPMVANQLMTESKDAASLAVDAAKLTPVALDTEQDGLAFASELKSHLTPINENRPQNIVSNTSPAASNKPVETPVHHIATPVGESRWGDAVAQRVGLMLGRQEQKIEMTLNPPNLGPMEVRLNLAQDQASVVFSSQNAAVRDALAAAMPRLTNLLADQGFTLTNVQVASDSLQQHQQQQNQQQAASGSNQQNSGRELGAAYALQGGEVEKMQELGALRLPLAKGGVSLFV